MHYEQQMPFAGNGHGRPSRVGRDVQSRERTRGCLEWNLYTNRRQRQIAGLSFNKRKSVHDLESAIIELAGAYARATEVKVPVTARDETMSAWLNIFTVFDRDIDPVFDLHDPNDPKYAGTWSVIPPPLSNGFQYPALVPPSDIKEPDVRATYEADIADNKRKLQRANFQIELRRANELTTSLFLKLFVRWAYTSSAADQSVFNDAIDRSTLSPERKVTLKACFPKEK